MSALPTTTEPIQTVRDANPWRTASSRAIHPSARDGGEPLVAAIAAGLAEVSIGWELSTGESPTERQYELLLETDLYDAWLIHWPSGTGLEAHDHGGSTGAFTVVAGVLDEDTMVAGTPVTRRINAGETVCFDGDHVHAVVNRGAAGVTSVHVYSPPLRAMGFYREGEAGELVVERVDDLAAARG